MSTRKLTEHGALVEAKGKDGVFSVRIITEGEGSSGVYSRELLKEYKDVFANRAMHLDHPKDPSAPWERSVTGIAGRTGNVEYREVDGVAGLYTEAKVRKEYREFMEEFGDLIGVSIYASGTGKEEDGKYIVESFDPTDEYTSVDWVVAAGRGGRIEKMMESYRQIETSVGKPADDGASTEVSRKSESKESNMEIQELAEKVDKLAESVTTLLGEFSTLAESLKPVEEPAEETDLAAVVEMAVEAGLPKQARDVVVESVRGGASVEDAIAKQTALVKAITESLKSDKAETVQGRVVEGASGAYDIRDRVKVGA